MHMQKRNIYAKSENKFVVIKGKKEVGRDKIRCMGLTLLESSLPSPRCSAILGLYIGSFLHARNQPGYRRIPQARSPRGGERSREHRPHGRRVAARVDLYSHTPHVSADSLCGAYDRSVVSSRPF